MFGDISSYYTEIRQADLFKAYDWVRSAANSARSSRSQRVSINRHGSAGVRWGRSYDKRASAELPLDLVFTLLRWNVSNCRFTWGSDTVLSQDWGIAMGTPPAPSDAITVAAYWEHCWDVSIYGGRQITLPPCKLEHFDTCRYMGDTASAATY